MAGVEEKDLKALLNHVQSTLASGASASLLKAFERLVELVDTLSEKKNDGDVEGGRTKKFDLVCPHCNSIVYQPVTLGNGRTYCKPCVEKLRDNVPGREVGFGVAV